MPPKLQDSTMSWSAEKRHIRALSGLPDHDDPDERRRVRVIAGLPPPKGEEARYLEIFEEECERNSLRRQKEVEQVRMAMIEWEKKRPFWKKYKEEPPPSTFEEAKVRIQKLEEALETCLKRTSTLEVDNFYLNGFTDLWPELSLARWGIELKHMTWECYTWASARCIITRRGDMCEVLSQQQKRDIVTGLKGFIVQDDLDRTFSRLPPNVKYNFLANLATMIIMKDCLRLFWSNPFWYLELEDEFTNSDSDQVETPFGAQLNALCEVFLNAQPELARRWRSQTARLANLRQDKGLQHHPPELYEERDPTFGLANKALRKAKAFQFAAARLKDDTFRALIKEDMKENEDTLKESLGYVYFGMAEFAKGTSTSQPCLKWKLLDELPTKFQNHSQLMEIGGFGEFGSRLDRHEVLVLLRPHLYRVGGVGQKGEPHLLCKAEVYVDEPAPPFESDLTSDEDARPKKKRKKQKGADTKKPAKGKAKKARMK